MRINARLDEQTAEDLAFLRDKLGDKSITEVLKISLQQLADDYREKARAKRQKQIWKDSGLIGSIDGPENHSVNYKEHLTEYLDEKYAHHIQDK